MNDWSQSQLYFKPTNCAVKRDNDSVLYEFEYLEDEEKDIRADIGIEVALGKNSRRIFSVWISNGVESILELLERVILLNGHNKLNLEEVEAFIGKDT